MTLHSRLQPGLWLSRFKWEQEVGVTKELSYMCMPGVGACGLGSAAGPKAWGGTQDCASGMCGRRVHPPTGPYPHRPTKDGDSFCLGVSY